MIFFLTDAERMEADDAKAIRDEAGAIRIQAVEFGDGPISGGDEPPARPGDEHRRDVPPHRPLRHAGAEAVSSGGSVVSSPSRLGCV